MSSSQTTGVARQMTGNLAISPVTIAASAGCPPSCAPAARSTTAPPCQQRQIRASLHPNRSPSGEYRLTSFHGRQRAQPAAAAGNNMMEMSPFAQALDGANRPNPYPLYALLRKTPVHREEDGTYVVSTYAEIRSLLSDPRVSSDDRP